MGPQMLTASAGAEESEGVSVVAANVHSVVET